jgi:hypothetical protein
MLFRLSLGLLVVAIVAVPVSSRPNGNPKFRFDCRLGSERALFRSDSGVLTYRFETKRRTKLQIRQNVRVPNVFYRYDSLGPSGGGQQLRFVGGRYSYGIASWFFAGPRGGEGVGFFVMRGDKVIRWQRCRGNDWFSEDNRLDRLPHDSRDTVVNLRGLPQS